MDPSCKENILFIGKFVGSFKLFWWFWLIASNSKDLVFVGELMEKPFDTFFSLSCVKISSGNGQQLYSALFDGIIDYFSIKVDIWVFGELFFEWINIPFAFLIGVWESKGKVYTIIIEVIELILKSELKGFFVLFEILDGLLKVLPCVFCWRSTIHRHHTALVVIPFKNIHIFNGEFEKFLLGLT